MILQAANLQVLLETLRIQTAVERGNLHTIGTILKTVLPEEMIILVCPSRWDISLNKKAIPSSTMAMGQKEPKHLSPPGPIISPTSLKLTLRSVESRWQSSEAGLQACLAISSRPGRSHLAALRLQMWEYFLLLVFSLRTLANIPSHRKSPKPRPVPPILGKCPKWC